MTEFIYTGNDLGANYYKDYTIFKVWSLDAQHIKVVIYDSYDDVGIMHHMNKEEDGIWSLKLYGDYGNKYYNYMVKRNNIEKETPDPYTKGATLNGKKGMIVDFASIDPVGWKDHLIPKSLNNNETIIYEMHIRDFSVDINSGIKNKGKYLAFVEENTKLNDVSTGLDHLKELGITHIHLLPISDFGSIDESKEEYNWGYDPHLYYVPEGSYSTNPYDGRVRIHELKKMIKSLHENNIRIVMDVVFNHTFKVENTPFDILAPKYYYRTYDNGNYSNGSGCGNEIASEKPMVRKFILDCIKFWATEYKIDGFRFDLMGLHDVETMNLIESELKKINSNILIYGEPWIGGTSVLDSRVQFTKGSQRGMQIAVFNDDFRNSIKGDNDGTSLGFVNGAYELEKEIKKGIIGSIEYNYELSGFTKDPKETINYVSSHDNLTLFDKFKKSNPNSSEEEIEKMNRLALSIILTSQGIPFIHGGSEILRSKCGEHNSYNLGDEINKIEWTRKIKYKKTFEYIKSLIRFRKSQKIMNLSNSEDIRKSLIFTDSPKNTVAYMLTSTHKDDIKYIFIIHNANTKEAVVKLPLDGPWDIISNGYEFYNKIGSVLEEIKIDSLSTYILIKP